MTNHENRTTNRSAYRTGALIAGLVVVGLVGVLALAAAPASAHEDPEDCNAGDLGISIARDKPSAEQGETVNFRVTVRNPSTGEPAPCDITAADVFFIEPAADGSPSGTSHLLAGGADFFADGSTDACFVATGSPLPCPGDTVTFIDDNLAWVVNVNDGVASATASSTVKGPLNQQPCPDGGAILHDSENDNAACAANAVSVTIEQVDLIVTKDAETSFDREWDWTITKVADQTAVTINQGDTVTINYDVEVDVVGFTDSNWAVAGQITVANPSDFADAIVTGVSDIISGHGAADVVDCSPVEFPVTLGPNEFFTCDYSSSLPDGSDRTNTATATVSEESNVGGGSGDADVIFTGTSPTNEFDVCTDVTDTLGGFLGTTCLGEEPELFEYSITYGTGDFPLQCGPNEFPNTATSTEQDTEEQTSADELVVITVDCFGDQGCTPGFWKNHPELWHTYSPGQTVDSVFAVPLALSDLGDDTLLQALAYGGGPGALGGAKNLLRQAVAALLNAADPDVAYPMTEADIISQVNDALASLDKDTMNELKNTLDENNNLGCGIDAHGNPVNGETDGEPQASDT